MSSPPTANGIAGASAQSRSSGPRFIAARSSPAKSATSRREIAYVGDTLNVAARLLEAAKATGRDVLVSADLLKSVALPPDLRAEPLPTLAVRGRNAPLEIFALSRVGQD